jgi:hypothetical protein
MLKSKKSRYCLGAIALCTAIGLGSLQLHAAEQFSLECAARDLDLFTTIEAEGMAGTIPAEKLAAASFALLEARDECRKGRITTALRMYGAIPLTLTETAIGSVK